MTRKNNIELCRICIMLFIVIHHCVVSGLGLNQTLNETQAEFSALNVLLIFLNSFVVISVNVFFLISGYFGVKLNYKKVVGLLGEISFYSLAIYLIFLSANQVTFSPKALLSYSVLAFKNYWFAIVYIALILTSPMLNSACTWVKNSCTKGVFEVLFFLFCILCFILPNSVGFYLGINDGYSYLWAAFLYMTGTIIKVNEDAIKKVLNFKRCFVGYVLASMFTSIGGVIFLFLGRGELTWKLYSYNAPFVCIGAVMFFLLFINISGNGRIALHIGKYGVNVFGVYLLHTMPLVREYRYRLVNIFVNKNTNIITSLVVIMVYCLILYLVCLVISRIRYKVVEYISSHIRKNRNE